MKNILKTALCLTLAIFMLVSCKGNTNENKEIKYVGDALLQEKGDKNMLQFSPMTVGETIAIMHTTMGDITFRFFPDQAPKAVMNFINHANDGYYNGVTFHRVMQEFMIQGGDPTGTGYHGESIWGEDFEDEFSNKLYNFYGALCMANSGANTNGSQFFIVQTDEYDEAAAARYVNTGWHTEEAKEQYKKIGGCFWLDGKHTVFGQVISGMHVVEDIAKVEVDADDKPLEDVVITSIDVREWEG